MPWSYGHESRKLSDRGAAKMWNGEDYLKQHEKLPSNMTISSKL